mgnify:CR=1 FL=1
MALNKKKNEMVEKWVKEKLPMFFLKLALSIPLWILLSSKEMILMISMLSIQNAGSNINHCIANDVRKDEDT